MYLTDINLDDPYTLHATTRTAIVDARTWLRRYFECGSDLITLTDTNGKEHSAYLFESYVIQMDSKGNPFTIYGVYSEHNGQQVVAQFNRRDLL